MFWTFRREFIGVSDQGDRVAWIVAKVFVCVCISDDVGCANVVLFNSNCQFCTRRAIIFSGAPPRFRTPRNVGSL